jgi:hypothetical protein
MLARGRLCAFTLVLVIVAGLGLARSARAATVDLSEDEFKTYHQYLDALQDKRVVKLKASQRLPAIAKNFKMPLPKLKAIVAKGSKWDSVEAMGKDCEDAIHASVEGTPLADRLDHVQVDVGNEHVVAYVSWLASDLDKLEEEAVLLAAKVKKAAPISADLRLWAEDPKNKEHKVFDGLVLGEAAGRFREDQIADFAKTRYLKTFQTAKIDRP